MKETLPWNLACAWAFRRMCRFYVTFFGPTDPDTMETLAWCHVNLQWAIDAGILVLATACPGMEFWQCAPCKSTAHKVAIEDLAAEVGKENTFVVNVDCDNGFSVDFVPSVLSIYGSGRRNSLYQWRGDDGGVTGRMGYWATGFEYFCGYDESLRGRGHQDVDLRRRFEKTDDYAVVRALSAAGTRFTAGYSVSNDPDGDPTKAFNLSKIVNCDPKDVQGKSWGSMNGRNQAIALSNDDPRRNEHKSLGWLGHRYTIVARAGDVVPAPPEQKRPRTGEEEAVPGGDVVPPDPLTLVPHLSWGRWSAGERLTALRSGSVFAGLISELGDTVLSLLSMGGGHYGGSLRQAERERRGAAAAGQSTRSGWQAWPGD
ncbi:MAG: hypothetical protein GY772_19850 [bacterium]|nr:hypothetical protein [bacterium]